MSLDQVSFFRLEKKKEQFLWQHVAFGEAPGRQPGQGVEGEVRHPRRQADASPRRSNGSPRGARLRGSNGEKPFVVGCPDVWKMLSLGT